MTQVVLLFFAAVLLFSSFKLLSAGDEDADDDADLSQNFIVKTCKCVWSGIGQGKGVSKQCPPICCCCCCCCCCS